MQNQRLLVLCLSLSLVLLLLLLVTLKSRPSVLYQKADLDAFSHELFQGIYSAIEQLEVATADKSTISSADSIDARRPSPHAEADILHVMTSLRHLEASQEVIVEGLSKVLELWTKLDEEEEKLEAASPLQPPGEAWQERQEDEPTILDTSDSILVADMDTSSELEPDSVS